jgi:predicted porin
MFVGSRQRKTLKSSKSFASLYVFWSNTYNFLNKGGWQLANPAALISTLENSQMKKTLIAMAAVAVAGVASAQATITGAIGARFESSVSAAGEEDKGIGMSDSSIRFAASEDLGGGLSLSASAGFENMTKGGSAPAGTGVTLAMSGEFGTVSFSNVESGDYLPNDSITTVGNGSANDRVQYDTPTINGFKGFIQYGDGTAGAGAHSTTNTAMVYGLNYSGGPLSADVAVLKVDTATHTASDGWNRFGATYDLGVATVRYAQISYKSAAAVKGKETGLTLTAPLGALTATAAMASHKDDGSAKLNGTEFSLTYALSKRTSVNASFRKYDSATAGVSPKRDRLTLSHSF